MSMPKFPDISPDITCENALNMILVSIAMEELALSHIINAEGEKLQFVLGTLGNNNGLEPCVGELLAVNQSITSLMDSVSQNQMILKSKMDKALSALANVCPGHPCPPRPPVPPCPPKPPCPPAPPPCPPKPPCPIDPDCKCSASFSAAEKCRLWCTGAALQWKPVNLHGKCVDFDSCDKTRIKLYEKGRFAVSFAVNVGAKPCRECDVSVSLQMISNHLRTDVYTAHGYAPPGAVTTISTGGIIIESLGHDTPCSLLLTLTSNESLVLEDSMLSIIEI